MKYLFCLLAALAATGSGQALDFQGLGPSNDTVMIPNEDCRCTGIAFSHGDGVFEAAFCWQYAGIIPPYYGAFGEAYYLGHVVIECLSLWLTENGNYQPGFVLDAYIWEGGVSSEPGIVLDLTPGIDPGEPGFWPVFTEVCIPTGIEIDGEVTVGYWADFSNTNCTWYLAADLNGPAGMPWDCIAPGYGFPSGWLPSGLFWGPMSCWGLGGYYSEGGTPAKSVTWGKVKTLFQ